MNNAKFGKDLHDLLEKVKDIKMTEAEMKEQMISFVYGNVALSNPKVTREMVEKIFEFEEAKLKEEDNE